MTIRKLFIDLADPTIRASFGGDEVWEQVQVDPGAFLVKEGDENNDFYYILTGTFEVTKTIDDNGSQKELAKLGPGDFFGEGSLLSDKIRSASIMASTGGTLLKMSQKSFEELVEKDVKAAMGIALGIMKVLNFRLQNTNERLVALYNVLNDLKGGDAIPVVLKELSEAVGDGVFVFFAADGMPKYFNKALSEAETNALQMQIPNIAGQVRASGHIVDGNKVYFAAKSGGILLASFEQACSDQDLKFLETVAGQM